MKVEEPSALVLFLKSSNKVIISIKYLIAKCKQCKKSKQNFEMGTDSGITSIGSIVKKTIDLSDSRLENAEKIPRIEAISAINLSKNLIAAIPSSLTYYSNLIKLDLSHNKITTLANISNLPQLQGLNLSNNCLTSEAIQESKIDSLKQLTMLNLNNNQLTTFPLILTTLRIYI